MQYTKETQEEVLGLLKEGCSVRDIHEFTNVSVPTIYRWKDDTKVSSVDKTQDIIAILKGYLGPKLAMEVKDADRELSEAMGTFSEKMKFSKLEKLKALSKDMAAL